MEIHQISLDLNSLGPYNCRCQDLEDREEQIPFLTCSRRDTSTQTNQNRRAHVLVVYELAGFSLINLESPTTCDIEPIEVRIRCKYIFFSFFLIEIKYILQNNDRDIYYYMFDKFIKLEMKVLFICILKYIH